jgi:hypothetical protein
MPANEGASATELPDNFHVSHSANLMQCDSFFLKHILKFDYSG